MSTPEQLSRIHRAEHLFRHLREQISSIDAFWLAVLPKSNHRLLHWRPNPCKEVLQVETLESKESLLHVRIYLHPTDTYIPTIVIGHPSVVGIYAWRDHKSAHPIRYNMSTPIVETAMTWPDDFSWLPNKQSMNEGKTMYYVRPTSFVLTDVNFLRAGDQSIKIKRFTNAFDGTELSHITSPNEWEEVIPAVGMPGLVITNSPTYVTAHPEYEFVKITEPQQHALLENELLMGG